MGGLAEKAKVSIRNIRREANDRLKKDLKEMMKLFKLAIERGGVSESAFNNISFDQDQVGDYYFILCCCSQSAFTRCSKS